MKSNKLKDWSVGMFHFTFGQLVYWSERTEEADFKESDRDNHIRLILLFES